MPGYPLKLSGVACVGVLACGPQTDEPAGSGSGSGSGYELTGTAGPTAGQTDGQTSTPTSADDSDSDSMPPPECQGRGEICGEMSVCQCDCDYDVYCCYCAGAECTDDTHCDAGETCVDVSESFTYVELTCIPAVCDQSFLSYPNINSAEEAANYEGRTCLGWLRIVESDLVDATAFASLEYIHVQLVVDANAQLTTLDGLQALTHVGGLEVTGNAVLTSVDALASLPSVAGGTIRDNPMLPTADVEAMLAGIEGGDTVEVCGNLDGDPCP